ncbi:hypothetical protein F5Y17DRAFT_400894 [Xylariaceae sp. FL0594]|nr:hypothetical protein F5Y17DRAFT_400894 [Xylariaceae sp. FL0594]
MYRLFNGYSLSQAQLQAKAEAAAHAEQFDGNTNRAESGQPGTPRPHDACEWRDDLPEPEPDDLAHQHNRKSSRPEGSSDYCGNARGHYEGELSANRLPKGHAKQPAHGKQSGKPPVPSPGSLPHSQTHIGVPEIRLPSTAEKASRSDSSLVEDGKKPGTSKSHTLSAQDAPTEPKIVVQHPSEDSSARLSPWVDSLDQRSEEMEERVNKGYQQPVNSTSHKLASPVQHSVEQSAKLPNAQEPTETGDARRGTSLAPEPATHLAPDFYVSRATRDELVQQADEDNAKSSKAKEKERKRAERKAKHEAKRQAKKEKAKEKKQKRREKKERRRKEKQWKKTEKKGGELPAYILQGLRDNPDIKIPYNPRCDICSKSAVAAMSSSRWNPKCTLCAKAAQREATSEYVKSSKIRLGDVDSLDGLISMTRASLKKKKTGGGSTGGFQEEIDNDLAKHIALHIQESSSNGGEAALRGHTCNDNGQPGHLARQGLDGNRDSPSMVDRYQVIHGASASPSRPSTATTSEADWWVQAVASNHSSVNNIPVSAQPDGVTRLRRSKSTVCEPRVFRASMVNRPDASPSVYHFYLPFAVCHSYPCSPGHHSHGHGWPASVPPEPAPVRPTGHLFGLDLNRLTPGQAETIPSDTPRQSVDGFFARRNESV